MNDKQTKYFISKLLFLNNYLDIIDRSLQNIRLEFKSLIQEVDHDNIADDLILKNQHKSLIDDIKEKS